MALGGRDVLKLIVDADSSGASREFDRLGSGIKRSLGDVEKQASGLSGVLGRAFDGLAAKSPMVSGIFDKLGVSGTQAGAAIASAIPMAAVAAGGAIAAFAAKGVSDFQNVALAAGKFGDATGLGVEQASRWLEVAGDIGIASTTVQSAFIKMEKAIAANRGAFGDMVATGKNGAVDLSATFLNVTKHLQGIKDPIERAAESSKLFGKGFAEVSQLIGMDADNLKSRLEGVSDVKVITPEELAKARKFAEAMNALTDAAQEAGMRLGQELVPQLTKLAGWAATGIDIAVNIKSDLSGVSDEANKATGGVFGALLESAQQVIDPVHMVTDAVKAYQDAFGDTSGSDAAAASAQTLGAAVQTLGTDWASAAVAADQVFNSTTNLGSGWASAAVMAGSAAVAAANVGTNWAGAAAQAGALADETLRMNAALQESTNAQLAAFSSTFAVADAQRSFEAAVTASSTAAKDGATSASALQGAYDNEAKSALAVATATVDYATKQAEASGAALSAQDANNILIGTLQTLASTASGPVQASLAGMIAKLQETGAQEPRPTVGINDQATGPLNGVQAKITSYDGMSPTADINAADHTSGPFADAQARGNAWSGKTFTATIQTITLGASATGPVKKKIGGPIPGPRDAPYPVIAHGGEYVLSADVVDRIKKGRQSLGADATPPGLPMSGGGGSGRIFNLTVNAGVGDPVAIGRAVKQAIAAAERAGVN